MKLKSTCILAKLSEDQHAQLYDWILELGYAGARDKLALPAPDGFGIKTYTNTLYRFFTAYADNLRDEERLLAAASKPGPVDQDAFTPATTDSLNHRAYQLAAGQADIQSFTKASHWWKWKKELEIKEGWLKAEQEKNALAEKRLALEKLKFEFSAARAAIFHFAELQKICTNPDTDDEQKIWETHGLFYGKKSDLIGPLGDGIPRGGTDQPATSNPDSSPDVAATFKLRPAAETNSAHPPDPGSLPGNQSSQT